MTKNIQAERDDHESGSLQIRTDLERDAVVGISGALRLLLADVFGLYVKTKNFHWHMTGSSFRDFYLLLDEQSDQIFAMTDDIAERARKIGGSTIRSISDISRHQRLKDNNDEDVTPQSMLRELQADNLQLIKFLRGTHEICERHNDVATARLIEKWIDETERRTWFLSEVVGGLYAKNKEGEPMAKGGHLRGDQDGNAEKPRVDASANGYTSLILCTNCRRAAP